MKIVTDGVQIIIATPGRLNDLGSILQNSILA
jgi:superfamily II DNA/RNA helicase